MWRACSTSISRVVFGSEVNDASRGRRAVMTRIVKELAAGGSVFWVFPLVNESEHFEGMASANQVHRAHHCSVLPPLHRCFRFRLLSLRLGGSVLSRDVCFAVCV